MHVPLVDDDGFDRNPEEKGFETQIELLRTPKDGTMTKAIVLSTDMVGAFDHWNSTKTVPHTKPWCEMCHHGVKIEWHGYIAVMSVKTREVCVFVFTLPCKVTVDNYIKTHGSLRGGLLLANRVSAESNARIRLALSPSREFPVTLPPCPDVKKFLLKMWKMPNGLTVYPPVGPIPLGKTDQKFGGIVRDVADLLDDPRRTLNGEGN